MIVAGFGFTSRASAHSLEDAFRATGHDGPLDAIAVPDDKAAQPALLDVARARSCPIRAIQPDTLEQAQTETQSFVSRQKRGTGSVAEAAALAAAGPGATLIATRRISQDRMATCAIARGPDT